MNFNKKLVGNLGGDQIWSMWIYKERNNTFLKVRDEKVILQNVRSVLNNFPFQNAEQEIEKNIYIQNSLA